MIVEGQWSISTFATHPNGGGTCTAALAGNAVSMICAHPNSVVESLPARRCLVRIKNPDSYIPDPGTVLLPNIMLDDVVTNLAASRVRNITTSELGDNYTIRKENRTNRVIQGLQSSDIGNGSTLREVLLVIARYLGATP